MQLYIYPNYTRIELDSINEIEYITMIDDITSRLHPRRFFSQKWQKWKRRIKEIEERKGQVLPDEMKAIWSLNEWDGKIRYMKKYKNKYFIPTGILYLVEIELKKQNISYDKELKYEILKVAEPDYTLKNGITLRDYQQECVEVCMSMSRGVLNLATNAGKTEIFTVLINNIKGAGLVIVPTRKLLTQTADRIEEGLGQQVGRYGGQHKNIIPDGINVMVVNSAYTLIKKKPSDFKNLMENSNFLISDECHRVGDNRWYDVAIKNKAPFRFGFSGTAFNRTDFDTFSLVACTGRLIARVSNSELIEWGWSAIPKIYFIKVEDDKIGGTYQYQYKEGLVSNETRNNIITKYAEFCKTKYKRTIILVFEIEHGNILSQKISCPFVHGGQSSDVIDKYSAEFEQGKHPIMIASKIFDLGVNIPELECIIMASGGKSTIATLQRIGRGLRKTEQKDSLTYIDFYDTHAKFLKEHSEQRMQDLSDEGFDVKVLYKNV